MTIYIRNDKSVSNDEFYRSKYNDVFMSVYNANPDNLQNAIQEFKDKGCSVVEACGVLTFVLDMQLNEAKETVDRYWGKSNNLDMSE